MKKYPKSHIVGAVETARLRRPQRVQPRNQRHELHVGFESFRPLLRGRGRRKRGVRTGRGQWVNNLVYWMLTNSGFTPCNARVWLLEPMTDAAELAAKRAAILLSEARSSIDGFQKARKCREKLYRKAKSISWGELWANPNINGKMTGNLNQAISDSGKHHFSLRGFLREKHEANNPLNSTSLQKGRQ